MIMVRTLSNLVTAILPPVFEIKIYEEIRRLNFPLEIPPKYVKLIPLKPLISEIYFSLKYSIPLLKYSIPFVLIDLS